MQELKARKPKNPHAFTKAFLRNLGNSVVTKVATTELSRRGKDKASLLIDNAGHVARKTSDIMAWREAWKYHKAKKAWKKEYKALKRAESRKP